MKQVITIGMVKGGVGKTTTAVALAQAAASKGRRVLLIDLDAQANATLFLSADPTAPGSFQLLHGADARETIQATAQGIDVIAASRDLYTEESKPGSARRLRTAIEPIRDGYDIIIIDTPPSVTELLYNALYASTGLLIPMNTDTASLQGLYRIAEIAGQLRKSNPELSITGIVVTQYDKRPKVNRYMLDAIRQAGEKMNIPLIGTVRQGTAVRESQSFQQSLFEYAPKSNPARDYMELFEKINR